MFYGFGDATEATAWKRRGWTIDADVALATGAAHWASKQTEQGDGVMAVARIVSLEWQATGGAVSLAIDGDGVEIGGTCTLRQDSNGDQHDELVAAELGGGMSTVLAIDPIAPDVPVTLTAWRSVTETAGLRHGKILCRLQIDTVMTETSVALSDDMILGNQGLVAAGATVRIGSLIVYASPGPKNP